MILSKLSRHPLSKHASACQCPLAELEIVGITRYRVVDAHRYA